MNKLLAAVVLIACVFAFTQKAMALPYLDVASPSPYPRLMDSFLETQLFKFDLDNDILAFGDIGPADTINSVILAIYFADDSDSSLEYALVNWEVGPYLFEVDTGTKAFDVLAEVASDHKLNVSVTRAYGDFYLGNAVLTGDYSSGSPVPEPTSMMLLGVGILGLFGLRKRFV